MNILVARVGKGEEEEGVGGKWLKVRALHSCSFLPVPLYGCSKKTWTILVVSIFSTTNVTMIRFVLYDTQTHKLFFISCLVV